MSIQQRKNFNEQRMVSRTYDTIDRITTRFQRITADKHASVILDDQFWNDLQQGLTRAVRRKRRLLVAGGYADASRELAVLEDLAIRMAVETFRGRALDEPSRIHDADEWSGFQSQIREYAEECTTSL